MKYPRPAFYAALLAPLIFASGCSTVRAINEPFSIGENMPSSAPGRELAPAAPAEPGQAVKPVKKDDFIEVDDEEGIRKTWPMALFIALLALAAAAF
ncbi:MAG TPA: hypothetical protein DDW67_09415 [Elusimicrobia bacterium]|jgi:hypothetical protein|nr:hypothetical protein [Elusimicrobiota bacterium]